LFLNGSTYASTNSLTLHDALPIYALPVFHLAGKDGDGVLFVNAKPVVHGGVGLQDARQIMGEARLWRCAGRVVHLVARPLVGPRSEEHTSALQSRENVVCRSLLVK